MLTAKENHAWMIEEKEEDKVKALEIIELVEGEKIKTTRIGTMLSPEMKGKLIQFLKENLDIEPRGHAWHIPKGNRTQVKRESREEARPAKTTSLCSRKKSNHYERG